MVSLFILFLTYILIVIIFEIISIDNYKSKFLFRLIIIIFIISVYAVVKTSGYSIYVMPLLLIFFLYFNSKIKFRTNTKFNFTLLYPVFIWFLFYLFYYNLGSADLRLVFDDYLIYTRVAHYNDVFGNENMGTFYNIISTPSNEVYHFSEMWGMSMLRFINQQNLINNYYLVLCPLFAWISFLGLKELFIEHSDWLVFLIMLIIIFTTFPLDIFVRTNILPLPLVGIGSFILSSKNIFILPILISVFLVFENGNPIILAIVSFLYPVVIPVLYTGLFVYYVLYLRNVIKFIPLFFAGILFLVYTLIFTDSSGFVDFYNFFDYTVIKKVIGVGLMLPLVFIGPILYFLVKWKNYSTHFLVLIICIWISSLIFWILLYSNIDANQMFRNIFSSIFVFSTGAFIYQCFTTNRLILACFSLSILVIPFFFIFKLNYDNNSKKLVYSSQFIEALIGQNVLVIPTKSDVISVYDYNEKFYIPHHQLFLYDENINLFTISAAFPNTSRIDNSMSKNMINKYRQESIYFKECGFFDFSINPCLINFMSNYEIELLLTEELVIASNFYLIFSEGKLNLYRFDN